MAETVDPLVVLECLQERDPSAYQFLVQLPSGQAFFGSTVSRKSCKRVNTLSERLRGIVSGEEGVGTG